MTNLSVTSKYRRSLFIFRRDLRLIDNTALNLALQNSEEVVPIFFFDTRQIAPHAWRSAPGLVFMLESLRELASELTARSAELFFVSATPEEILDRLITDLNLEAVYFNRDYTPFSRRRDNAINQICQRLNVQAHQFGDALLHEPEAIHKDDGTPYSVYTPFAKRCMQHPVRRPTPLAAGRFYSGSVACADRNLPDAIPVKNQPELFVHGGRSAGLQLLSKLESFKNYAGERDFPALQRTTALSSHHKFGTISVRESFHCVASLFGIEHTLIRELLWRDFYHHIAWHFPYVFQGAFKRQYDRLVWPGEERWFQAWCQGATGFPIVDAGMRQLNQTGFMHNRVRMIVASFLVKDLLIDWRRGERYFAQHLVDYDPAVNNGSWQWAASTGCDAQPYFRIFNPWLQQERFDEKCLYCKRWVPELESLSPRQIHALQDSKAARPAGYPAAIVDHAEQKEQALEMFAEIKNA